MRRCRHCKHDEVRRKGLCNSCSLYERRTGRLPSQKVLYNRGAMRKQRAAEKGPWLVVLGEELTRELARLYAENREGAA